MTSTWEDFLMRRVEDPSPGQAVVEATVLYGSK